MFQRQTLTQGYWSDHFRVGKADLDYLFSTFLEEEKPLTKRELALRLIQHRIQEEDDKLRLLVERGTVYQPGQTYDAGQEILFPALDFALGKVVGERVGQNPEAGEFRVIQVEFGAEPAREFATGLQIAHKLNLEPGTVLSPGGAPPDAAVIFAEHGEEIIDEIEARLVDSDDAVYFGGRWFLRSLLVNVNIGQTHLAEALLDMAGGGPISTGELIKDLDFPKNVPQLLKEFSLDVALSEDDRFDEVGPRGRVWWYLKRLEPPEVIATPEYLQFEPFPYNTDHVTGELSQLERELDDEYSDLPPPEQEVNEARLTLIYPHRRIGTLPLTSRVKALFPTASEARRIRITLVDVNDDNTEHPAWVVHDSRCVVGLANYYKKHLLPIGAIVTIRRTDDPARLEIDFEQHKARSEYIRLAIPKDNRLTFANFKRSIGADYDELMILGAEDVKGVDTLWEKTHRNKRLSIVDLMKDLIPELSKLNPQNAVHAKTLYSAVNILRRCPPGPIFAMLVGRAEFENAAGPYWRLSSS
jgi:hypothetical protein